MRQGYEDAGLTREQLNSDPFLQFEAWFSEANDSEPIPKMSRFRKTTPFDTSQFAIAICIKRKDGSASVKSFFFKVMSTSDKIANPVLSGE